MARRVKGLQVPVRALKRVAVTQGQVGGEVQIQPLTTALHSLINKSLHHGASSLDCCAEGMDGCAGGARKGRCQGGVVQMGMGHHDGSDTFAGIKRRQNGLKMAVKRRAGVDHRHLAAADDVGPGARPGHRRGVLCKNPPQPAWHRRGICNSLGHV